MRVRLLAVSGPLVHVGRPGVRKPAVLREIDQSVAQLLVAGEPERDRQVLSRLPGRRCRAGKAGEGLRRREPLADVADLGEQGGRPDLPRPGQVRKIVPSGWSSSCSAIRASSSATWSRTASRARTKASVTAARASASGPVTPSGAASSRRHSSSGLVRPQSRAGSYQWTCRRAHACVASVLRCTSFRFATPGRRAGGICPKPGGPRRRRRGPRPNSFLGNVGRPRLPDPRCPSRRSRRAIYLRATQRRQPPRRPGGIADGRWRGTPLSPAPTPQPATRGGPAGQ